jgi:hypothetical protein
MKQTPVAKQPIFQVTFLGHTSGKMLNEQQNNDPPLPVC